MLRRKRFRLCSHQLLTQVTYPSIILAFMGVCFCTECSQDESLGALAALGNCQRQYFVFLQSFAQILFSCKPMREKYWRKAVPRGETVKCCLMSRFYSLGA
ncbi:hypothetical protein Y1Q_0024054 [Alligator mississippiensis]|uniref:Uncharacterized protein n=1 Tax=Alligator mississippiensis TaxID=8496 RepID=A0A151NHI2_ALLMI|nr:hypothetical protein Y1Q_0024054 [Alligator mississippiensis]